MCPCHTGALPPGSNTVSWLMTTHYCTPSISFPEHCTTVCLSHNNLFISPMTLVHFLFWHSLIPLFCRLPPTTSLYHSHAWVIIAYLVSFLLNKCLYHGAPLLQIWIKSSLYFYLSLRHFSCISQSASYFSVSLIGHQPHLVGLSIAFQLKSYSDCSSSPSWKRYLR